MAISSSSEVIREMIKVLQQAINEINASQENLKTTANSVTNWNDAQGQQYRMLMQKIAQLTDYPKTTLNEAIPKLTSLMQALETYEKIKF
jgi:prefoldin subunit 5